MTQIRVLICDDEKEVLSLLAQMLAPEGMAVELFSSVAGLMARLERGSDGDAHILLLDIRLPGTDGFQVLEAVRAVRPALPVVMMTAYGSIEEAVHAMRLGAYDFITKPCPREKILATVRRTVEHQLLIRENHELRDRIKAKFKNGDIVYRSTQFGAVYDLALRAANSDATILFQGESGTGKELLAAAVHRQSLRRDKPFLLVNCAVYSETHLEAQLFGSQWGGGLGASGEQRGLLEEAAGGTLYLDDLAAMPPALQAKLFNVLQKRHAMPSGAAGPWPDIRFLASSSRDLEVEVAAGRFRADLYDHLNMITISIPPLRQRPDDIEPLADYYLKLYAYKIQADVREISPQALQLLKGYSWPGNVRELKNIMERAVILADSPVIGLEELPPLLKGPSRFLRVTVGDPTVSLDLLEREHIARVLEATGHDKRRSSGMLGISRRVLERKLVLYGMAGESAGEESTP